MTHSSPLTEDSNAHAYRPRGESPEDHPEWYECEWCGDDEGGHAHDLRLRADGTAIYVGSLSTGDIENTLRGDRIIKQTCPSENPHGYFWIVELHEVPPSEGVAEFGSGLTYDLALRFAYAAYLY